MSWSPLRDERVTLLTLLNIRKPTSQVPSEGTWDVGLRMMRSVTLEDEYVIATEPPIAADPI